MSTFDVPVSRELFVAFLITAKQNTYAAQGGAGAAVSPLLPGSHQLEYREGRLLYRDIYFGGDYFAGQETVYYDTMPVWSMVYAGGRLKHVTTLLDIQQAYAFLQAALRHPPVEHPYRGPAVFKQEDFVYTNEIHGELERFWGVEAINYRGVAVYQLHYSGGVLR
ncbi:MAG TPA: DUF5680 domain-containing protein [Anaerolineae bacterium]|nr:DUF5680 domain-containing protein [Anaerolineae bacterium]HQK14843.1 DUF5680 domain-containing protein [Anaerolineae bacterium]